jgi:monoamine oxidase
MINLADALYGKVWATRLDELGANESRLEDGGPHPGFETNYHANDSFKQLIDYLSAGLQIRLNWQVKNVQVLPNKKGVRVVNQKGESIEAKHVVIAVPLPILQDGDITFEPALPKKKQVALSKLRMGHALKVILKFNKPFWNPKSQLIICSEALFPQMWPGGGAARNSSVFTMTAFVSGDCATKVSSLDDASKVRLFAAQLDSMYGTPSEPHPATKAMTGSMVFDWQKMPFVRGGYTYPATGSVNAKEEMVSVRTATSHCVCVCFNLFLL